MSNQPTELLTSTSVSQARRTGTLGLRSCPLQRKTPGVAAGRRIRHREGWNRHRERVLARRFLAITGVAIFIGAICAGFEFWPGLGAAVVLFLIGDVYTGWAIRGTFTGLRPYSWRALGPSPYPSEMVIRSGWRERNVLLVIAGLGVVVAIAIFFAVS